MATALRLASLLPLLLLASAASDSVLRLPSEVVVAAAAQREFDYFVLALQWPGTFCSRTRHCCPKNGCCRSQPLTDFTIHGLWSNYDAGGWPSCCDGPDFDIKKISSLIPELNKYWPTLSCSSSSVCHGGKGLFWAHEWEKHGTCSASVTKDEYSYFTTVLDLYRKYNITAILNTAGILATNSETYSLGDIVATIEKAVGASPLLVCKGGSIEELRLCFYKDFTPRDCVLKSSIINGTSNLQSSCPKYISLPTYAPMVPADVNGASPLLSKGKAFGPLSQMIKSLWG